MLLMCYLEPKHLKYGSGSITKKSSSNAIKPISIKKISLITVTLVSNGTMNLKSYKVSTIIRNAACTIKAIRFKSV
jgi:hypothetical protein